MKKLLKIILIAGVALALMAFGARASSDGCIEYIITADREDYLLSCYIDGTPTPVIRSSSLSDITEYISELSASEVSVVFGGVTVRECIDIVNGNYIISGSLAISGESTLNIDAQSVLMSGITLKLDSGGIRVKRGDFTVENSSIISESGTAIALDYSAEASFTLKSGSISSKTAGAAVKIDFGSALISGGEIVNSLGAAIETKSTLILSGTPKLVGENYGIIASSPITLSHKSDFFGGNVSLKYTETFEEGTLSCVFYSASENSLRNIKFYDVNGEEKALTFFESCDDTVEKKFGAVYLPYYVDFYLDGSLIKRAAVLGGKTVPNQSASQKTGYEFVGWSTEDGGNSIYDFAQKVNKSFNLYSKYQLKPPSFSISSLDFDYDGKEHKLGIDSLEHPLISSAIVNYTWYRDGVAISNSASEINVKSVNESGVYSCLIRFTYGTDTVSVQTPGVTVTINKAKIDIPKIESKYYNSEFQRPDMYSSSVYTVSESGGTIVGAYPVKISLNDADNYVFNDGTSVAYVDFKILKANNYWIDDPIIYDVYEGVAPLPSSASRFGSAIYLYSDKYDGVYTDSVPTAAGIYYCVAKVQETDNYNTLESAPISFSVIEEKLTGISILSMPNRCDYTAFQKFIADGLTLSVTYNSSRVEVVGADKISIAYQSADSFRYQDTAVIASYLDQSIAIPVNVEKAEYDIINIRFNDTTREFDGSRKSIDFSGILPLGLDGIPLECTVIGGGTNAGIYTVVLVFTTESKNYKTPASIEATLTVTPYESDVVFTESSFVYDGSLKCPVAYYIDIYGRKITLDVSGARSLAGEYTAVASGNDSNYKLNGSSIIYTISKADYNFGNVIWSENNFTYDGLEKSITLSGLPNGVSVIGYSDNTATDAGEYTAKVSLLYDEKNYNPPPEITHTWRIVKAEYALSGFTFADILSVYNGREQYPEFSGVMPQGADGIFLEYKFDRGVKNVSEGKVEVNIIFSTKSKNYNIPSTISAYVELLPLGIAVTWNNFEFVYDTASHAPSATALECGVSVLGAKTDAGSHIATAISLDSNYYVVNSTVEFVINKAVNLWTNAITVDDIFEGKVPNPYAECLAGEVYYVYYSDTEGADSIDIPKTPGIYYVQAVTGGNNNYTSLKSQRVAFEIKKIVPIGMSVVMNKQEFSAFDSVAAGDFTVVIENNDGSFIYADTGVADIKYQTSDSLRFGDNYISVSYLGFSQTVTVSVQKADYDMSRVKWSEGEFTYDGTEKKIVLTGLPIGVSVISYSGASGTQAGEYIAEAKLAYDSYNYNQPIAPDGVLRIKKQIIYPPQIDAIVYNGKKQTPDVIDTDLYTSVSSSEIFTGRYPIILTLTDTKNFEFPNSLSEITVYYEIVPRELTLELSDIDKYLWDSMPAPTYTVTEGDIADGDSLDLIFSYDNNSVSCISDNTNYLITVIPGRIIRHNSLSEDDLFSAFVIFLLLLVIIFIVLILILRRKDIIRYISVMKCRLSPVSASNEPITVQAVEKTENANLEESMEKADEHIDVETALSVDADHADSLITDSLAKNLVRKADVKVYTEGRKKRIINVDTLSENFSSGDSVDVNKLKEMSLIPYDTAYIKVLARGMIDKPLKVYANDFSLAAVKMIALTGGEAVRVITVRKKGDISDANNDNFSETS